MIVHTVYALIKDNEILNTIICDDYTMANYIAHAAFGDDAIGVEISQYAVGIGDKYHDGNFYHVKENGEEEQVFATATAEEEVPILKEQLKKAEDQNTILELALVEMYEGKVE